MLTSYCFSSKVHAKRDGSSAVNSHLITDRNVKDLSLENVNLILFEYESLYLKVWLFMSNFIPKGVAV